jgi:hypothetical protein
LNIAQRIAPAQDSPSWRTFHVVLVAEAFTAADEDEFFAACHAFYPALEDTPPFNLLKLNRGRIVVWGVFTPSGQRGTTIGTTPGNTVLGSTYEPGTRTLAFDTSRVQAFLRDTEVRRHGVRSTLREYAREEWSQQGVVAVLLPPVAGGQPLTADADTSIGPPGLPSNPSDRWFVGTTIDLGWERVVLEAIARCFGLGDEWSRSEDEFALADARSRHEASRRPNLFAATPPIGPPDPWFPWYSLLDAAARSKPLPVVPYGSLPSAPGEPVQLFEGAGRYRAGIYRSAVDCVLRRRIGSLTSPRFDSVDFCTVCRRHLAVALVDTNRDYNAVYVGRQTLVFDQVHLWAGIARLTTGFPTTVVAATPVNAAGPWWSFDAYIGAEHGGLRIENLSLKRQPDDSLANEDVAELIEFRDVVVEFDDGRALPFDIAKAFASTTSPPTLQVAERGQIAEDRNFQRGIKLTLRDDLQEQCPVELEMSFVVKGEAHDIEPSGGLWAAKFYPQIGLTALRGAAKRVKRFRACVRLVLSNSVKGHTHSEPSDDTPQTVASFFVDTNYAPIPDLGRRMSVMEGNPIPPARGFPLWTFIFDYHKPDVRLDTEVYAVYGPRAGNPRLRRVRETALEWPPGSGYEFEVYKDPDQGQYDNFHVHGSMGHDPFDPRTPKQPMVHAPGCAEACIHLHWRWGAGADSALVALGTGTMNAPVNFRGWNRSWWGPRGARTAGMAPMIPPNQDLKVAVTSPLTTRVDPLADAVQVSRPLDPARKALWYTVDVTDPHVEERQVLLEMGIAFCYRYNFSVPVMADNLSWLRDLTWQGNEPDLRGDDEVLHLLYSLTRWFITPEFQATGEQIPSGTFVLPDGSRVEDF